MGLREICKRMSQFSLDICIVPCSDMTMENLIPQMGGVPKQMVERYAEYPATHDQHFYYTYEPAPHSHGHSSSKYGGGGHKSNAAMSALTLLAFLFFLHILQQCLKDHMTAMSTPQVMIMSSGKEGEENISKISRIKSDKSGITKTGISNADTDINKVSDKTLSSNDRDEYLMKITTSDHAPQSNAHNLKNNYKYNDFKTSSSFISTYDKK